MPERPLRPCARAGCRELTRGKFCEQHDAQGQRAPDRRASAGERGYTYRWRKESKRFLAGHPWCAVCLKESHMTAATEVDHRIPHKGSWPLFWNMDNWQALCHRCHSQKTAREDGGFGHNPSPPPRGS